MFTTLFLFSLWTQLLLLKCRCGVEGFFCIARNNTEYELYHDWFFSDPELDTYLLAAIEAWDAGLIRNRLETFSLSTRECAYLLVATSR